MDRYAGGLWGLLIGDALGVPYEFSNPQELPPIEQIEMEPPKGYSKAYPGVPVGTWSDDGAQALCLLDSLLENDGLKADAFTEKMLDWLERGLWTPDGKVFDVGVQTSWALTAFRQGTPPEQCGMVRPEGKGNGSLMRVLPLALWHRGEDRALAMDAHRQSLPTHGHPCNQVCCALYSLTARRLLEGLPFAKAFRRAVDGLREIYAELPVYAKELELLELEEPMRGNGTGYVVDCLKSAFMVLEEAESYEDAVKRAIALGNDTDTTACVTGGLAGIRFGAENIPTRWMDALQGKPAVQELLEKLKQWRS